MKVFAHRGESAIYPENSQTAIELCDIHGMDGIEIDLYQTIDNNFVVFHDRWLTRILGRNKKTTDLQQSDLSELKGKDDKPIPTLSWTIAALAKKGLILNIELKHIRDIGLFYNELLSACESAQFDINLILVSSFNHQYLAEFAQLSSFIKLGYLVATHPTEDSKFTPNYPIHSVHLSMDCISPALIQKYQLLGYPVYVFTVDQKEEIIWLLEQKVDGVFSNNPRLVKSFVQDFMHTSDALRAD